MDELEDHHEMSTPIQDRPFDGWEVVAGIRLQWLEAKDAEIKLLTVRLLQVEEQNAGLRDELHQQRRSTKEALEHGDLMRSKSEERVIELRAEADRLAIELRDARTRMEKMGVSVS